MRKLPHKHDYVAFAPRQIGDAILKCWKCNKVIINPNWPTTKSSGER